MWLVPSSQIIDLGTKIDKLAERQRVVDMAPIPDAPAPPPDKEAANPNKGLLLGIAGLLFVVALLLIVNLAVTVGNSNDIADIDVTVTSIAADDDDHTTSTAFYTDSSPLYNWQNNYCADTNPGLANQDCEWAVANNVEQAGANVTKGYVGSIANNATPPISVPYYQAGLCPVNVHWHLGAEHLSVGEYDEHGVGPDDPYELGDDDHAVAHDDHGDSRKLASGGVRAGFQCRLYDETDSTFTTPYNWEHCVDMMVGQTYEIHWPHSTVGACGTPLQYQTPFYDGVFCNCPGGACLESVNDIIIGGTATTHDNVGVQSQVFTVVNDENYYYPDLFKGMITENVPADYESGIWHEYGQDIAYYTGSTTGTSRDNEICSQYSAITWQVDRKCHLISASSFDKLCADMKTQVDDMSDDLYAHGSRELVADELASTQLTRE